MSKCTCTEETGCDDDCQNRYMFYECDDGNCGLGRECGNRSFDELKYRTRAGGKYNIGVEVIKTADRGYGVRSNRTFEPNQIIVEYTGEIITQTECEKRMRSLYKNNEVCRDRFPIVLDSGTDRTVLLFDVLRPEHDHRRHARFHCSIREPFVRAQLPHGEMDCRRKASHGAVCRRPWHHDRAGIDLRLQL